MKTAVAMLRIALSVAFAGASVASVIDKAQHQGQSAHHHEHMAFSVVALDDHHQDNDYGNAGDLADAQDDDAISDHQPGSSHHHADGPTGFLVADNLLGIGPLPGARLLAGSDGLIPGPGSPGPERPPKSLTTSV